MKRGLMANKLLEKSNNELIECMLIKSNLEHKMREKSLKHELVVRDIQLDL